MRVIVLICVLFASVASAQAARDYWILGTNTDSIGAPTSVSMIDVSRITTSGGIKTAWLDTFFPPGQRDGLQRTITLVEIDCAGWRMRTLRISAVYRGSPSPVTVPGEGTWETVRQRTAANASVSFVCASNQQREANPALFHLGSNLPQGAADLIFER